ncbi:MAG: DNA polymerase I [Planctomycetes bacterium]|nr:DNA polymerase I [Planctomycetota bacterium]
MPAETLAIIDGHYYAYRFFFAMPPLIGPGGRPTGVTFSFANLFLSLRNNAAITHWACVFDDAADTFRHTLSTDYKAQRDPMPDALGRQIADVETLCAASRVPMLKVPGYEADDILATLAKQAANKGMDTRICSRDKDIDQVLSERIRTWDPGKDELRGPEELLAEKGLTPRQVIDYLCMMGDSSDNVPGIKGVGPKTAVKLLAEYATLENVLANVDKLKGKLKENVVDFIPRRALTCQLISLVDVPGLPAIESLRIDREFAGEEAVYASFGFSRARFFPALIKAQTTKTRFHILSLETLRTWLTAIRGSATPRCSIVIEATSLDPLNAELVGISFGGGADPDGLEAAYLPLQGVDHATVPWESAKPLLKEFFEDPRVAKVAHDSKHALRVLARHGIRLEGLDGDVMLASWLLDPSRESHSLDYLTKVFLGEEKTPSAGPLNPRNHPSLAVVAVASTAQGSCEDASCAWRLALALEPKLDEAHLLEVYRGQELPLARCLAHIESAGLRTDRAVLAATQRHLESYLEQTMVSIRAHAGSTFNPASPKQVAELLFEKLKLPVITQTKSGPSTDAAVLEALRHHHELPDLLLQYRQLSKLIGTYLTRLPEYINEKTGRIHTRFKQTGTETGRLSSDQPNLQNIPKKSDLGREIRGAFIAPDGHVFIAADYSQIELRVLAHLSGDPTLTAAFAGDVDIHRYVAAQVNGIDEASVSPAQRHAAKAINFGIIYGQSAFGLGQLLGIPRPQAQKFIDGYFARFSRVRAYIDEVIAEATSRGWTETMAGRRRYIPQLNSSNRNERLQGERIALNSTIQGSAADLIKRAMLRCESMLPDGARLILQIHDELLIEAELGVAPKAADALRDAMVGAWKLDVALIAAARTGRTWLEVS